MNKKDSSLPAASICTGIIGFLLISLYNLLITLLLNFLRSRVAAETIPYIIIAVIVVMIGLSLAAIICGSIDLSKINRGMSSKKGRLFDIMGIALGSVSFLASAILMLGQILLLS